MTGTAGGRAGGQAALFLKTNQETAPPSLPQAARYDHELHNFSLELLKKQPEGETEIPAAEYPGLPLLSEMLTWHSSEQQAAMQQTTADKLAMQRQEGLVQGTGHAGADVLGKLLEIQSEWTGLDAEDKRRKCEELNAQYHVGLKNKSLAEGTAAAKGDLEKKVHVFTDMSKLVLEMNGRKHTATVVALDLSQPGEVQNVGRYGEYSWKYAKSGKPSKELRDQMLKCFDVLPKGPLSQALLRTNGHALDVSHGFPHKNDFKVSLMLTSKDRGPGCFVCSLVFHLIFALLCFASLCSVRGTWGAARPCRGRSRRRARRRSRSSTAPLAAAAPPRS